MTLAGTRRRKIQISIIEVPFMKINESIEIGTKEIEIDLSQYHVGTN